MTKFAVPVLLIMIISVSAFAQNQPGFDDKLAPHSFYIDFVPFKDSLSDSIVVEVYFKAFSSALSYEKWGEKFKSSYEINIVINKKRKQVTGITRDGDLFADNYKMTRSKKDFIIDKFVFKLLPDNYELVGRLVDSHSGNQLTAKTDMKLKNFGKKTPFMSGIQFLRESEMSTEKSQFARDGLDLIPSVSKAFGYDEPEMKIYYQVYNLEDFQKDYLVYYEILINDKSYFSDTTLFPSNGAVTGRVERFDVESLLPGIYELTINVQSPGGKLDLKEESVFIVEWSIMGIVKNDFKTAVEQLRYIASGEEMKALKKASEGKRLELWLLFWESKDPSPGSPDNELREEYYQRVRYSDLNFGHFGRDGWKTDMGMVYVTYGSPDEIERHPFDVNTKPYQIWFYYEQKRRFVFVDFNGYGDYDLQYPYDGDIGRAR
ncbi:MAG: GWxTD domain-containing protein [candidate division Zixibacteria bacterium]